MAYVGLRTSVFVPITGEKENTLPTYGEAIKGHERLTSMKISWQKSDGVLYADDVIAEADNGVTGGSIEMGADDLSKEFEKAALGVHVEGTGETEYLEDTDAIGTPGGYGYVQMKRYKGETSYIANFIYKVLFSKSDEEAKTKGEKIEFSTPTVEGTIMGVFVDTSGSAKYRRRKEFKTYAEALTWLQGIYKGSV